MEEIGEKRLCTSKYDTQNVLLEGILQQINTNATIPQFEKDNICEEIDVVISGGGMKGFFSVGCWSVLKTLIEKKQISVKRWAGTSVGAGCVAYMCCGIDPVLWSNTYWRTRRLIRSDGVTIVESFKILSDEVLPDNAHELCSGKVFISITLLTVFGPKNIIVSKFHSKSDLIEAVTASCSIPFMTSRNIVSYFRGMRVLDGGFTNNTPLFHDSPRRQLVLYTPRVHYPSGLVLNMKDPCIDSLIIRGAFIMRQFMADQYHSKSPILEWKDAEPMENHLVGNWKKSLQRGVESFNSSIQFSREMLSLGKVKSIEDETTSQRVANEIKRTVVHYRMAIFILLVSSYLMATPLKWEDTSSWKRFAVKYFFIKQRLVPKSVK
mmetsp:Transcript_11205/g.19148  ORF Transcript_11205/g.19148 Transcript_11205/m.19148 type:complete len:379 (-) Transcript_11205:103-1239(-)